MPEPSEPFDAVIIGSAQCNRELFKRLDQTHQMTDLYEIRPNVLAVIWVRKDVWQAHLQRLGRL